MVAHWTLRMSGGADGLASLRSKMWELLRSQRFGIHTLSRLM
jgi:hypothetical protein